MGLVDDLDRKNRVIQEQTLSMKTGARTSEARDRERAGREATAAGGMMGALGKAFGGMAGTCVEVRRALLLLEMLLECCWKCCWKCVIVKANHHRHRHHVHHSTCQCRTEYDECQRTEDAASARRDYIAQLPAAH